MADYELLMPKMGESIMEATILKWMKQEGDTIEEDEIILEIATDKVDSEIPSPVNGVMGKILYQEGEVVPIGSTIATIRTESDLVHSSTDTEQENDLLPPVQSNDRISLGARESVQKEEKIPVHENDRFYSPLVRNIARREQISAEQLASIEGTGLHGRVTKSDILSFVEQRETPSSTPAPRKAPEKILPEEKVASKSETHIPKTDPPDNNVEIIEMDRMRKMIAEHMVHSKKTSAHVTSFVEADVSNIVHWRNKNKGSFEDKYQTKLTYTPIFIEAVVRALKDFPQINSSVDGNKLIIKKNINIGMATALADGNLIVPVIKNADRLNLAGLSQSVNELASRARNHQLEADEIQGGTFTLTNVGVFGNLMGTPIINQPQVAILATGAINKKVAVIEIEGEDIIAIRQKMFLSLSYDHRVIDGFVGGSFLRKIADYLETFDKNQFV